MMVPTMQKQQSDERYLINLPGQFRQWRLCILCEYAW